MSNMLVHPLNGSTQTIFSGDATPREHRKDDSDMDAHILLVEDDRTARMLLADVLKGAGYQVTMAPDGEAALEVLGERPFDVVITDIRMRTIDGIQVLQKARERTLPPAVILLTGFGSLETAIAALRSGAFDYLLKPVAPNDLLERVDAAVQRRTNEVRQDEATRIIAHGLAQLKGQVSSFQQSGVAAKEEEQDGPAPSTESTKNERYVQIGALVLDYFRHTASFKGQPMHLTPIEYSLLCCLADSTGRVVSYQEIVRCSHGYEPDEAEAQSLLKAHIRNLRRKIDSEYLVNVRGTGYILVDPTQSEDE
jgi:DNA-binding response OmpR family regulator